MKTDLKNTLLLEGMLKRTVLLSKDLFMMDEQSNYQLDVNDLTLCQ